MKMQQYMETAGKSLGGQEYLKVVEEKERMQKVKLLTQMKDAQSKKMHLN